MRIFIAHNKGDSSDQIDIVTEWVRATMPEAEVVTGEADWRVRFPQAGGWQAWTDAVATGRDVSGRPNYDAFIVSNLSIGRATAAILGSALAAGKPVLYVDVAAGVAEPVQDVMCVDPQSWKAGYVVRRLVPVGRTT